MCWSNKFLFAWHVYIRSSTISTSDAARTAPGRCSVVCCSVHYWYPVNNGIACLILRSAAVRPDPVSDAAGPAPMGPRDLYSERPAIRGGRRAGALRARVDVQAVQLRAHAGQLRVARRARVGKPRVRFVLVRSLIELRHDLK